MILHIVTSADTKLAIEGGVPVRHRPLPPWPEFDEQDVGAVASVLQSGRVSYWTGPQGKAFEEEFAAACGARHAVAVANGTVALELALYALGIGPGDEVIVPCRSFVSSASCIVVRGATPVMVDIDRNSQTITAQEVAAAISRRTKAILAVHLAGWPCDMDPIVKLAREHGLLVVEDSAQAQGAQYKGRSVGVLGDVGAFSFCQDKIMTTGGEGGMLVTNDFEIWQRAWSYRDHGRSREALSPTPASGGYRFVYDSPGTNWRMTEMQSALGRSLLSRVESWVVRRIELARQLDTAFATMPAMRTSVPPGDVRHAYYRYYAFVRPEGLRDGWTRNRILEAITAEGIPCYTGSCPELYREKAFAAYHPKYPMKTAREVGETSLAFLVHPTITDADMTDTIQAVRKVMSYASVV